jgi:hypothetical protein
MTNYTTLARAKAEIKASSTIDDALVRRTIATVSKRIDAVMGSPRRPFFAPYTEQRGYLITADRVGSMDNTFLLKDHILAFTAVLKQTTSVTSLVELYAYDNEVATMLRFTNSSYNWYPNDCGSQKKIYVTGTWGWNEDYTNAFDSVDTIQDIGGINASVTSVKVADADGADLDGFTPRFSPGNLVRIESELLEVTAVNTTTNVLTVRRGVNGTTAAIHAAATALEVYRVDERIDRITARQTALLYARRGAFQVETLDGVGVITYPQDLLTELLNSLTEFLYQ